MSEMNAPVILGGDTPFFAASDAWRVQPADHQPTRFYKDGVDHTRLIQVGLLATGWTFFADKSEAELGATHREFMRQMIAGANTDLRALGIGPLISIAEIEQLAPHFAAP